MNRATRHQNELNVALDYSRIEGPAMADPMLHRLNRNSLGRPLYHFKDPEEFLNGLRSIVICLQKLADLDMCHCDITISNTSLVASPNPPNGEEGFLFDFEYTKLPHSHPLTYNRDMPESVRSAGPVTTGTLQFMAIELLLQFGPRLGADLAVVAPRVITPTYKSYHDLESLVWVVFYALCKRVLLDLKANSKIHPSNKAILEQTFQTWFSHKSPEHIAETRSHLANSVYGHPIPVLEAFKTLMEKVHALLLEDLLQLVWYQKLRTTRRVQPGQPQGKKMTHDIVLSKIALALKRLHGEEPIPVDEDVLKSQA
ncbi:unnamed protein product [Somion occarium]